nr:uncharacterized protein LOC133624391 [Nerophis lumbriciformis]
MEAPRRRRGINYCVTSDLVCWRDQVYFYLRLSTPCGPPPQVDGFFTLLLGLSSFNTLTAISLTRYVKGCPSPDDYSSLFFLHLLPDDYSSLFFLYLLPTSSMHIYSGLCSSCQVSMVICTAWSPYAGVSMWSAFGFHVPNLTSIFTRLFAKSASFYNPLIYFSLSSKFRTDVGILLPCGRDAKGLVKLRRFKLKGEGQGRVKAPGAERKYNLAGPAPTADSGRASPVNKVFSLERPHPSETRFT